MDRDAALRLVETHIKNKNLRKHMLATEAVMRGLARHFGEEEELWALTGLLHDLDYEETGEDLTRHGLIGAEILEKRGFDPRGIQAIKAHAFHTERQSFLDQVLFAVEPLTGLIVAAALIHPDRKLGSIDAQFVLNRFKEKAFARGVSREEIKTCEDFGLSLEEFVRLSLEAMQGVAKELGL
ncbi:MAG: HDIG domain-containing protein [candidate division NC10 bacterium]|nr:HDIG domain-containing protein [candidate division NC10 bacterium]